MQRVADLEAQRITRSETARHRAGLDERVPQLHRVARGADQLDAGFARVAGARDRALDAGDARLGERERRGRERIDALAQRREQTERRRPLKREHAVAVRFVDQRGGGGTALAQMCHIDVTVAGVDDEQVAALAPVGDEVVDDPPALVREQRVLRFPRREAVEIVREHALQEGVRPAGHQQLSHVRDVEEAGGRAYRMHLVDHTRVLDGHLPTGEGDEAPARFRVACVQRRAL